MEEKKRADQATVWINREARDAVKIRAARESRTMSEVIEQALAEYYETHPIRTRRGSR